MIIAPGQTCCSWLAIARAEGDWIAITDMAEARMNMLVSCGMEETEAQQTTLLENVTELARCSRTTCSASATLSPTELVRRIERSVPVLQTKEHTWKAWGLPVQLKFQHAAREAVTARCEAAGDHAQTKGQREHPCSSQKDKSCSKGNDEAQRQTSESDRPR